MTLRCRLGDLAIVVRNTSGCACTGHELGTVIRCTELLTSQAGPFWALRIPVECSAGCGGAVFGYLDADLQPIRPAALLSGAREWEGAHA